MHARTRIICTVAPPRPGGGRARDSEDYVPGLIEAGMDVARINLSHCHSVKYFMSGEPPLYDEEEKFCRFIRRVAAAQPDERHVGILLDLQGIKIRVHVPREARAAGMKITAGQQLRMRFTQAPAPDELNCDAAPGVFEAVARAVEERGEVRVGIGDGQIFLRCRGMEGDAALLDVTDDGLLQDGKGVTFRGVALPEVPALPVKDRVDLAAFAVPALLRGEADFLALSFTRSAADVTRLKDYCLSCLAFFRHGRTPEDADDAALLEKLRGLRPDLVESYAEGAIDVQVVAKIETPLGVENIDEILEVVDAVMVARGDLGLSCPPEDVPRHQKEIIRAARAHGRPAVVATQMLLSMETEPEPRRPEAADVFNAVLDGADALMLSGETAVGSRPVETVRTLERIALEAEKFELGEGGRGLALRKAIDNVTRLRRHLYEQSEWLRVTDQITFEGVRLADDLRAAAIVGASRSGRTIFNVSRFNPRVPVIALVHDAHVARRMALVRAVQPVVAPVRENRVAFQAGLHRAVELGKLEAGRLIVAVGARPDDPPGATTVLEVCPAS